VEKIICILKNNVYVIWNSLFLYSIYTLKFKSMPWVEFWCSSKDEYPQLSQKAVFAFLLFATTYMCETGFSTYVSTKTKYRNRLDAETNIC